LNHHQIRANTPALSPAEARIEREAREERERVKATESGTHITVSAHPPWFSDFLCQFSSVCHALIALSLVEQCVSFVDPPTLFQASMPPT
jgi:hypothetical protein